MTRSISYQPGSDHIPGSGQTEESSLYSSLFSILLPPVCTLCNENLIEEVLCVECRKKFEHEQLSGPCCQVCSEPYATQSALNHTCGPCASSAPPFVSAKSLYLYKGAVLEALHRLKYSGDTSTARPLGRLLSQAIVEMDINPAMLLPIPLHIGRLRKRSFNQSLLIARVCARTLSVPLDFKGLRRVRDTGPQVGLNRAERARNMKGAFELLHPETYYGERVLLVDDVYTTGATMRECAKLLKDAGAIPYGITVARAAKFV